MQKKKKNDNKMTESRRRSRRSGVDNNAIIGINVANLDDDSILDILSRLPVKTLMRFKCVCKQWRSLIQYEPFFRDLQLIRSKRFQDGVKKLLLISPVTDEDHGRITFLFSYCLTKNDGLGVVKRRLELDWSKGDNVTILKPVNGLVCLCRRYSSGQASVLIYNPSTGERTSWIQSTTSKKETTEDGIRKTAWKYGFGFDPVTKEYKVICIWKTWKMFAGMHTSSIDFIDEDKDDEDEDEDDEEGESLYSDSYEVISAGQFCEVLTVGENRWRRLDEEVPRYNLEDDATYANGSIYWRQGRDSHWGPEVLIEFDLAIEQFRVIPIPDFVIDPERRKVPEQAVKLLEVDGRIAVVEWESNYQINLWRYNNNNDDNENRTSDWIKEIIRTPFMWHPAEQIFIEVIDPEWIILCGLHHKEVHCQLRNADMRVGFKIDCDDTKGLRWIANFVECFNLLPVQKHHCRRSTP